MPEKPITRRAFLEFGGAAALTAGAIGLTGCSPQGQEADEARSAATAASENVSWDKEADVVIVGFGGAGGAAAIEAKRAGAEVVVLEELDHPGGSTAACGGSILMADTPLQKKFGLKDSVEAFYDYMRAAGGAAANQEALKVLCDFSPQLYDWCVGCGMDFEGGELYPGPHINSFNKKGYTLFYTGNEQARAFAEITPPVPRGHSSLPNSSGADVFSALQSTADALGVEVLTETAGKRLVTDAEGRVVGVSAEGKDGEIAIRARKAVVLTAGGFADNESMMAEHYPHTNRHGQSLISAGNENGSGILMGQAVGAATRGMGCFQIGKPLSTMSDALPRGVLVDGHGRRIVAEDEYNTFVGRAIMAASTERCFLILDDRTETEGGAAKILGEPVATCNSIDEVAAAVGANPAVMGATIAFYNESASLGEDREFGKDPQFLVPLEQGPYHVHACGSEACVIGTCGGLKIDTDAHVLDRDGNVIPGLYAAGRNSGSIFGWYMGSGASVADVLTFGIIAGRNAAAESGSEETAA
ncbi:MAG TPA: FAD-dependent oxidoreductase [Candidatus Rubneribacter avistercoris]|nr:FAD-dependent oxidoreductase [Candidatus Rubneribacter avistercoris]